MKILVPLDGSRFAERALPVAVWLAERLDADIHLFSAATLEPLLLAAGAVRVTFDYVPGHIIAVAKVDG